MVDQVYRARKPKASPLWHCLSRHFDALLAGYVEHYQPQYGFLRPIIPVDDLSLYLSLRDSPDERVQGALTEMMEAMPW